MREDFTRQYLRILEHLTVPRYLQRWLEETYQSERELLQKNIKAKIAEYKKRIADFSTIPMVQNTFNRRYKKDPTPQDLVTPLTPDSNFSSIAEEAAIYFKQGHQMLKTSSNMQEESSPLVEYYGFLQCVKGTILLELWVNQELFFSKHGLTSAKTNSCYINAEIKPFGVFSALLLRRGKTMFMDPEKTMMTFFSGSYCLSLEEIINKHIQGDPVFAFIGSWMLSTLVRYRPKTWDEILQGKKDEIIRLIRDYRTDEIAQAIRNLLIEYAPDSSPLW